MKLGGKWGALGELEGVSGGYIYIHIYMQYILCKCMKLSKNKNAINQWKNDLVFLKMEQKKKWKEF